MRTLNEIGVGDVFDGCTPVRDVTIYGPGGEQLASPVPPIDGEAAYGYVIPRIEFDQRLFNRALAEGAEDLQGHRFTGMRLLPDRREIDLRTVDGTELTVQARLVVGADGAYSAVRKELDPAAPSAAKNHTLLAMRAYADSPDSLPGAKFGPRLLFEFTRDLLPSYGWIFPADGGQINIGAGGPIPILRKRGIDLKVQIHVFADQMRARGIEIGELRDVRAHQLPHVAGLARLSHPRAVLLGDAAAMINPVSGEGIAYAVAAACGLAQALPDDLADADALQSALDGFERAFRRHHRAHFASICISSAMLHSKTWAGILLNAAQRDPKVLEDGVNLLFGFGRIRAGTVARTTRSGWKRPTPPHRIGETVDSPRSGEPDSTGAEAPGGAAASRPAPPPRRRWSDAASSFACPGGWPWTAGHRGRERVAAFAFFALGPTIVFWTWFLAAARHSMSHSYRGLELAMPVSALWITFGPLLMQQWEYNLERLSRALIASHAADRWDLAVMRRAAERADRGYLLFALPMTIAAPIALWLAYPSYQADLSIRGPVSKAGGLAVIAFVGFVNANGMWAAYKSVQVVRAVTATAHPAWYPHRASQPPGMPELARFSWSTAFMFSAGAVFLPSLLIVQGQLPLAPRLIVLLFVAILFAGGFALFAVVFNRLGKPARAQQGKAIDQVAESIERVELTLQQAQLHHNSLEIVALSMQLRSLLTLRGSIQAVDPLPLPQLISRAASTLLLPLVLTALQFMLTSAL